MDGHKSRTCAAKENVSGLEAKPEETIQNKAWTDKGMENIKEGRKRQGGHSEI